VYDAFRRIEELISLPTDFVSDCFKVLQYWCFAGSSSGAGGSGAALTTMSVGTRVHLIKPTVFKAKIASGVEDELKQMSQRWCEFSEKQLHRADRAVEAVRGSDIGSREASSAAMDATDFTMAGSAAASGTDSKVGASALAWAEGMDQRREGESGRGFAWRIIGAVVLFILCVVVYRLKVEVSDLREKYSNLERLLANISESDRHGCISR